MLKKILFPVLAVFLAWALGSPCAMGQESGKAKAPLGLNLAGIADWSSDITFVDAFKSARTWISQAKGKPWGQGGPLDLDAKGNVRSLAEGQFAETVVFTGFENLYPTGTFTCFYEGEGDLDFTGDARAVKRQPGQMLVDIKPKHGSVFARITRIDDKNPIRNIRLILPGFEKTYQERPFHPEFLARWQGFKVYRYMDWGRTNGSKIETWNDRPTLDMHSQTSKGVAPEYMIQLSNIQKIDPWFCIPHQANDDYVRQLARMVKERLNPALEVYIEYSNECWNGQFEQARYCMEQGQKLGLSKNLFESQLRFYSQRSVEIFKIWEEVLGGKERLVRVLAMQSVNPWTGKTVMDWQDAYKHADAIAIAPYFGHRFGNPKTMDKVTAMSVDELVKALEKDVADSAKHMVAYAAEAKKRGLKLMAYEGGQHLAGHGGAENNDKLTKLFQAANRHSHMKDLYLQDLKNWNEAGGDLFCVFSSMGRYSKWGSWGLLEHTGQNPGDVSKYRAIREYLRK